MNGAIWSLIEALSPDERQDLFTSLQRTVDSPMGGPKAVSPPTAFTVPRRMAERYQVNDRVGAGGMGAVHRVRDRALLRESAMKVLAPHLATQPIHADRFVGEAQIQAQLEHPNIVPVHDLSVDDDGARCFTMRLLRGTTLGKWIRKAIAENTLAEYGYDMLSALLKVCDAVAFAHHHGVVHGDITPENVVVEDFGAVYLVDWGLARLLTSRKRNGEATVTIGDKAREALLARGVAGTPAFMSPEQAHGRSELIDERTDVFGLGGLLHMILTGRSPHAGGTLAEVQERARTGTRTPGAPTSVVAEADLRGPSGLPLPAGIRGVVVRALAIDRADRYQGALDLKREVERFLRGDLAWPVRRYAAGTPIVKEGDAGNAAFVVVEGTCVVYKRTARGGRSVLREVGPGGTFGEATVFSPGLRTATVEACSDVVVRVVTRTVLEEGLGLDSSLGAFVAGLAEQFRDLDARSSDLQAGADDGSDGSSDA